MTTPTIEVVQLTPELAHEFLSQNTDNYRKIQTRAVQDLANAMRRGEFSSVIPSNDAITFAEDGVLINGQHRCQAVIRSGVTIPVIVMRGGSADTADVMDTGMKRGAATVLARHGYINTVDIAGVVRGYSHLIHGYSQTGLTNAQILNFVDKHYDAIRISLGYGKKTSEVGVPRTLGAAVHFAASQPDRDKANEFSSRLADGVGLYPGNPIHTLRQKTVKNIGNRHQLDRTYFGAIMIKSWNAWYDRRSLKVLKWRGEQSPNEPFPAIVSTRELVDV